jgi:hypothetical protein
MEGVPGRDLARTLAMVRKHKQSLPVVSTLSKQEQIALEEKNVRDSLDFAWKKLTL